jgi:hypothetical protein
MRWSDPCAPRIQNSDPMPMSETSPTTAVEETERPVPSSGVTRSGISAVSVRGGPPCVHGVSSGSGQGACPRDWGPSLSGDCDAAGMGVGVTVRAVHARTDVWDPSSPGPHVPRRARSTTPKAHGALVEHSGQDWPSWRILCATSSRPTYCSRGSRWHPSPRRHECVSSHFSGRAPVRLRPEVREVRLPVPPRRTRLLPRLTRNSRSRRRRRIMDQNKAIVGAAHILISLNPKPYGAPCLIHSHAHIVPVCQSPLNCRSID